MNYQKGEKDALLKAPQEIKSPSIASEIQTIKSEKSIKSPVQNQSIWGTFHFIAKPDQEIQTKALGPRALSPVVNPNCIPQEVLEDIYGGRISNRKLITRK